MVKLHGKHVYFFSEKMLNYSKLKNLSTPLESDTWHGRIGNLLLVGTDAGYSHMAPQVFSSRNLVIQSVISLLCG